MQNYTPLGIVYTSTKCTHMSAIAREAERESARAREREREREAGVLQRTLV